MSTQIVATRASRVATHAQLVLRRHVLLNVCGGRLFRRYMFAAQDFFFAERFEAEDCFLKHLPGACTTNFFLLLLGQ
jgi:hypothetical protein